MLKREAIKRPKKNKEVVYLVYSDVVGSSELDRDPKKVITWRKDTFFKQLNSLLNPEKSLALKSIGDALFVLYECVNMSDEKSDIKEILHCIREAFVNTKNPPIRAVVHRITGHKRGGEIKKYLEEMIKKPCNMKYLTDTLEKDIFGTEVNRAARILSLVHKATILVSEDVASKIDKESHSKAITGENINFDYRGQKYKLHSPVPVLYMKGVFNYHDKKIPYVIWELVL